MCCCKKKKKNQWQISVNYFGRLVLNAGEVDIVKNPSLMFPLLSSMVAFPLPCFCLTMALCLPTVNPLYGPMIWQHGGILVNPVSPKKGALVWQGQLLTAGTQELLEPSRARLYIVPNPHSDCEQARDSKGNINTVLGSGCLSISSIPLFLKKEIKRRTACGFLFSWDLSKFWEQNRVDPVASSHFLCCWKYSGFTLQGSCKPCHGYYTNSTPHSRKSSALMIINLYPEA